MNRKEANWMIWGGWGAIFSVAVYAVIFVSGTAIDMSPTMAASAGFFWGIVCAHAWNWAGRRR